MKIFKKIKEQIKNYFAYSSEKDHDAYQYKIDTAAKELESNEILNFTSKGFNYIFEDIILQTSYDLVIFVKNYESMFDENKLNWIKLLASKFDRTGDNIIRIYTYSGEANEQLIKLTQEFRCVYYTPLNFTDDIEANNFIVADKISYWLEEYESAKNRTTISNNIKFKAKVNFKDASKSKELVQYVNGIDKIVRTKLKANSLKTDELM
jgi:hypothetical protein